ncbi:unnamed protein product [Rotaria sp. Silwood2]|nr:unnamed protein product [Rotaria sp. Silwood2]CAF4182431.1 unnamed protein product [Rotaria sp. Silwood2]
MNRSETIINTYRNSINNTQGDIKNLSKDDLAAIINLLSNEIDENLLNTSQLTTDGTLNHSINNNSNHNEIMMGLLDQNSMLIKTFCAPHCYASHHQSCNLIYPVSSSNPLAVDNYAINGAHS